MPAVIPSCAKSCSTSNRSRGCCRSIAATSLPPYMSSSETTGTSRSASSVSRAFRVSDATRTGWTVPRMTKLTSILTSMAPCRTSSLVSPASAEAGAWFWKPCFLRRAMDWRMASLMRRSASSRGSVWSGNTRSRSTESRGMSRTNRLIAVPPLSANVSSTSTSGATLVSNRALSRLIELTKPRLRELAAELQAEAHGLDAGASLEQLTLHISAQTVAALHQLARFLQRLANTHLAQNLQQRALRHRDERRSLAVLEGPNMQKRVGALLEEPLAVVLGRKALGEPPGEAPRLPAVKVENRPLGHVVADAMPVERGLATNVQSVEAPLQQGEARVQHGRIVGAAIDPARQSLKPACPDIMDGKISRYPEGSEILGGQRRPGSQVGVELV